MYMLVMLKYALLGYADSTGRACSCIQVDQVQVDYVQVCHVQLGPVHVGHEYKCYVQGSVPVIVR